MNIPSSIKQRFTGYTDGFILGSFRMIFGLVMIYEMLMYFKIGLIKNAFILPKILLPYEGFQFLSPLPEPVMNVLLGLMLLSAVCITVGVLFRPACIFLGTFHLYFFLLDKSLFNNHIYLFILLAFLLSLTHADEFLTLKNKIRSKKRKASKARQSGNRQLVTDNWQLIPRWEVFILQFQFAIVYFYGGLAKINPEWLGKMQPMKYIVEGFPDAHWMAPLIKNDWMPSFLTYGGLVFDLVVPFLLWNKHTRKWTLIPIVLFHLPNSQLFHDIGVFPFAMLAATILFFETKEVPFLRNLLPQKRGKAKSVKLQWPSWVGKLAVVFMVFQLLFPFRGFFLPNPMDWTSIANRFAWRMKIQSRDLAEFTFYVQDGPAGKKITVPINTLINTNQIKWTAYDVRAVAHVGRELAKQAELMGINDPVVTASIKVEWNGRPATYFIDPTVDLSKVEYSPFKKVEWAMEQPE